MDYRQIIESRYNRKNWQELLFDIFRNKVHFWQQPQAVSVDNGMAKSAVYTGNINLPDGHIIAIYEVELSDSVVIERNRAGIRNLLCSNWRGMGCSGAFMFCYRQHEAVLRFSYVSEAFAFAEDGSLKRDSTDTKRYTYLLGEGHRSRTAIQQFEKLKASGLTLKDITKAFSVEALSDLFFHEYKKQYEDIIEFVTGKRMVKVANKWEEKVTGQPCREIMQEFATFPNAEKAVRDYVKKLMGRLVFIQFLQKKGWMGCSAGEAWNDGDREFVQNLFANSTHKDTFVDDVLEPLFNDINTRREGDIANAVLGVNIKVPYLNGGLFEKDEFDKTAFPLPAKYMKSMLDFFSSYNFTIDENDPNDAEVGVDPEMLGRIFENLLEDNKDKGAFYTPKEIVQYMCRESLIAYLQTDVKDEHTKDAIRQFVTTYNDSALSEELKEDVDQKLKDVKICDPAIGSGAFPMGLLRELYACRKAIEGIDDETAVSIKTHIIQNNIYGVDIEKGAVDIARLRFWLALIVDETTPQALPNMDFKIMQGNSLLEQYEGVELSGMSLDEQKKRKTKKGDAYQTSFAFDEQYALDNIQKAIKQYYLTDNHDAKVSLRQTIDDNVKSYILNLKGCTPDIHRKLANLPIPNDKFFLWHIYFKEVFDKGGFDIVIGNPPWGVDLSKNDKETLKKVYSDIDSSTPNSFAYFIGWGLGNYNSSLSFVLPDSILIKDFQKARKLLSGHCKEVIWYQNTGVPRDKRIFRDVEHDICLILLGNNYDSNIHYQTNEYINGHYVATDKYYLKEDVITERFEYMFNLKASNQDWNILKRLTKLTTLGSIAQCHEGIHTGNVRDKLFIDGYRPGLFPLFYGGRAGDTIQTYVSRRSNWYVNYDAEIIDKEKGEYASLRDERIFILPKIYVTRTGNPFKAFYDADTYASNNFFSLQLNDYKKNTEDELLKILPLINSKFCQYYIRTFAAPRLGESFIETKIYHLLKLPIPVIAQEQRIKLITLVKTIIERKKNPTYDTTVEEREIDRLVYNLYNLTEEEIAVIEGQ